MANDAIAWPLIAGSSQRCRTSSLSEISMGTTPSAWSANTASASGELAPRASRIRQQARQSWSRIGWNRPAAPPPLRGDRRDPAGRAELGQQVARLLPRRRVIDRLGERCEQARCELGHALRERAGRLVEKGADRRGIELHVNFGSRLAWKAACASVKFEPCMSCA